MNYTQQYPAAPMPPAPAPKKQRKWPWIAGIFVAFLFGVSVGGVNGGTTSTLQASAPTYSAPAPTYTQPTYTPPTQEQPAAPAPADPAVEGYGDGDWLVGSEIEPGKYESRGAKPGFFELCSVTTRDANGNVLEWKTANADERILIDVSPKAETFEVAGCEPFTRVKK